MRLGRKNTNGRPEMGKIISTWASLKKDCGPRLWELKTAKESIEKTAREMKLPAERDPEKFDVLEVFKEMMPGHTYIYCDRAIIEEWLEVNHEMFETPETGLFGCEKQFGSIAKYWLRHGKHNYARREPEVLFGQKNWDEFIAKYVASP
jgi:hypothetical protein